MKRLLADSDYLVGYDADGNYIRISKGDLAASVATVTAAQGIQIQYSSNSNTWHDAYTDGDAYMRIKAGDGEWSGSIRIAVSAYQIWREANGGIGTEEDFLNSLRGNDGESPELGNINLSEIGGYNEFLESVSQAVNNAKLAIVEEVTTTLRNTVKEQYNELNLEDIKEIKTLSDGDFITVVTADGLRKVRVSSFVSNVSVKTVSDTKQLSNAISGQQKVLTITGAQNENNVTYSCKEGYVLGTTGLYLNGQRLVLDVDYIEDSSFGFTMLTHLPSATDRLVLLGVPLQ